jgi:hypothetical protein
MARPAPPIKYKAINLFLTAYQVAQLRKDAEKEGHNSVSFIVRRFLDMYYAPVQQNKKGK